MVMEKQTARRVEDETTGRDVARIEPRPAERIGCRTDEADHLFVMATLQRVCRRVGMKLIEKNLGRRHHATVRMIPRVKSLLVFLGIVAAVALLGGIFQPDAWYFSLKKPTWNPPPAVFAPVWTILYVMIAIGGWLLWTAGARTALMWWAAQLLLNGLWSPLFFGAHRADWALVDIVLMWIAIGGLIASSWRVKRAAALLFLPYWMWVSFATALNWSIWRLN